MEAKSYLMHGPDIDTGKVRQEYIPADNVHAYRVAGWDMGPITKPEPEAEPLVIDTPEVEVKKAEPKVAPKAKEPEAKPEVKKVDPKAKK